MGGILTFKALVKGRAYIGLATQIIICPVLIFIAYTKIRLIIFCLTFRCGKHLMLFFGSSPRSEASLFLTVSYYSSS